MEANLCGRSSHSIRLLPANVGRLLRGARRDSNGGFNFGELVSISGNDGFAQIVGGLLMSTGHRTNSVPWRLPERSLAKVISGAIHAGRKRAARAGMASNHLVHGFVDRLVSRRLALAKRVWGQIRSLLEHRVPPGTTTSSSTFSMAECSASRRVKR